MKFPPRYARRASSLFIVHFPLCIAMFPEANTSSLPPPLNQHIGSPCMQSEPCVHVYFCGLWHAGAFSGGGRPALPPVSARYATPRLGASMLSVVACLGVESELCESRSRKVGSRLRALRYAEARRLLTIYFLRRRAASAANARMLSVVEVGSGMVRTSKYTPTFGTAAPVATAVW